MAALKLLNLLALSSIAILAVSFGSTPVAALSVSQNHVARRSGPGHEAIAKKKRDTKASKRCKPRSTGISISVALPTKTTSHIAPPAHTSKSSNSGSSNSGSGAGNTNPPSGGGSGSSSPGGAKAGVAYVGDNNNLAKYAKPKSHWHYNWSPFAPGGNGGLEYVPMFWGPKQTSDFQRLVVKGYASHVLGFNEPNEPSQSNLSPGDAAQLWKQYIQPLKSQGYTLVSPACTNAPSGKTWMQQFIAACTGCTIDKIAVHFYGTDPQKLIAFLQDFHSAFPQQSIWLTEFACQDFGPNPKVCSKDDVFSFLDTTTAFMDSTSWIEAYFWFGFIRDMGNVNPLNQLVNPANGNLNDLGQDYLN